MDYIAFGLVLQFLGTCVTAWVAYRVAKIGKDVDKVHVAVNSERTTSQKLISDLREEVLAITSANVKLEAEKAAAAEVAHYDPT